jgi:hypothetical protein
MLMLSRKTLLSRNLFNGCAMARNAIEEEEEEEEEELTKWP